MRLRNKLLSGYFFIALVTVGVAYFSLRATNELNATFDAVTQKSIPAINDLNDLRYYAILAFGHASEMSLAVSNSMAVDRDELIKHEKDELNEAYKNYALALTRYQNHMEKRNGQAGSEQSRSVDAISNRLLGKISELTGTVHAETPVEQVIQKVEEIEAQEPFLLTTINAALSAEVKHLNQEREEVYALITRMRDIAVVFGPLSIMFAIFITMHHSKEFVRALTTLKNSSLAVASGRWNKHVPRLSNDEFGDVVLAFNDMASKLHSITTRVNASREYMDEILESMTEPMVVTDMDGNMKTVNHAMLELLGKSENELLRHSVVEIFANENKDDIVKAWIPSLKQGGRFYHKKSKYVAKDGREIPVIASASSLHDHNGQIDGMVYMGLPVSEVDLAVFRAD